MPPQNDAAAATRGKRFTRAEVAKHNTPNDAWIVIDGQVRRRRPGRVRACPCPPFTPPPLPPPLQVYDVSSYVDKHPGGRVLLSSLGEGDSTGA